MLPFHNARSYVMHFRQHSNQIEWFSAWNWRVKMRKQEDLKRKHQHALGEPHSKSFWISKIINNLVHIIQVVCLGIFPLLKHITFRMNNSRYLNSFVKILVQILLRIEVKLFFFLFKRTIILNSIIHCKISTSTTKPTILWFNWEAAWCQMCISPTFRPFNGTHFKRRKLQPNNNISIVHFDYFIRCPSVHFHLSIWCLKHLFKQLSNLIFECTGSNQTQTHCIHVLPNESAAQLGS